MKGGLTGSKSKSIDHSVGLEGSRACGPDHLQTPLLCLHEHRHVRRDSQQVVLAQVPMLQFNGSAVTPSKAALCQEQLGKDNKSQHANEVAKTTCPK